MTWMCLKVNQWLLFKAQIHLFGTRLNYFLPNQVFFILKSHRDSIIEYLFKLSQKPI